MMVLSLGREISQMRARVMIKRKTEENKRSGILDMLQHANKYTRGLRIIEKDRKS